MEQEKKIKLNNHASFSSVRFRKPRHPRVSREMQSEAKKERVGSYHGVGGRYRCHVASGSPGLRCSDDVLGPGSPSPFPAFPCIFLCSGSILVWVPEKQTSGRGSECKSFILGVGGSRERELEKLLKCTNGLFSVNVV